MSTADQGTAPSPTSRSRRSALIVVGLLVAAAIIAGIVSGFASGSPDGLNRVAEDKGFSSLEQTDDAEGSPFAGYSTSGVGGERLSGGLAGVVGVALTFVVGGAIFLVVRRRPTTNTTPTDAP